MKSFEKVADHIYANKNYSGNIKEVIQLTEDALERDRAFFGELQCIDTASTIVIICDDDDLLSKLGGDHDTKTSPFDPKKNYISVSDEYLNIDIIAHELTHAELHTRTVYRRTKSTDYRMVHLVHWYAVHLFRVTA